MSLNQYLAVKRREILEDLKNGLLPREGEYDEAVLGEARARGAPQMGTASYRPDAILVEFIFSGEDHSSIVFPIKLDPPERIVFLPVPAWVVESIWQGEVSGTYHFESDALRLVEEFRDELSPNRNERHFAPKQATGRG